MTYKFTPVVALYIGTLLAFCQNVNGCPNDEFTVIGDFCYLVTSEEADFDTGYGKCMQNFAGPTFIDSQAQMDLISNFLNESVYLGMNDIGSEGTFIDASAEPITYSNFITGEPNNLDDEDCVVSVADEGFMWDDVQCNKKFKMLCQIPTWATPQ